MKKLTLLFLLLGSLMYGQDFNFSCEAPESIGSLTFTATPQTLEPGVYYLRTSGGPDYTIAWVNVFTQGTFSVFQLPNGNFLRLRQYRTLGDTPILTNSDLVVLEGDTITQEIWDGIIEQLYTAGQQVVQSYTGSEIDPFTFSQSLGLTTGDFIVNRPYYFNGGDTTISITFRFVGLYSSHSTYALNNWIVWHDKKRFNPQGLGLILYTAGDGFHTITTEQQWNEMILLFSQTE